MHTLLWNLLEEELSDDAMSIISYKLLKIAGMTVIHHTDCGMEPFR
jgi:carbonic anhydrase